MNLYAGLACCFVLLFLLPVHGQEPAAALKPLTVCEVLENLKQYEGHAVAVLGRFSYRAEGRWVSEDECTPRASADDHQSESYVIWLSYEPQSAPRLAGGYQLDGATISEKLPLLKKRTSLKQFRFGTSDYDRWAVVYGLVRAVEKPA